MLAEKGNHVQQIASGYAESIAREYESTLRGVLPQLADTLPIAIRQTVCHLFLLLVLHHAAAFDRRVVRHFSRPPPRCEDKLVSIWPAVQRSAVYWFTVVESSERSRFEINDSMTRRTFAKIIDLDTLISC